MNQSITPKLSKLTGALLAAGIVSAPGFAIAAVTGAPTIGTKAPFDGTNMFIGKDGTHKIRVTTSTGTATAAAPTLWVNYYNGTSTACVAGSAAGAAVGTANDFSITLNCTTATFDRIVLVYESGAGDTYDASSNTISAITKTGTLANTATTGATNATVSAAASAAGNTVTSIAKYTGPIVSSASQSAANGAITLNFNAELSGSAAGTGNVGGAGTAPTANVTALKIVNGAAINSAIGGGTAAAAAGVRTLQVGAANFGGGTYTSGVNKVTVGAGAGSNIYDTAGNATPGQTVYASSSNTNGVAFASGTAKATAGTFSGLTTDAQRVDFWNAATSTNGVTSGTTFVVTMRMNEQVGVGSTINTTTVTMTPAMGAFTATGTANGTDLTITFTVPNGMELGANASGQLVSSTDNWATTPTAVTIGFASNTSGSVKVDASGTAVATGGVTAVNVMIGDTASTKPTLGYLSTDSDTDGFLDGVTLRTHDLFDRTYTVAQPSFTAASGTIAGSGLSLVNVNGTNPTFATTVTAASANPASLSVILNNKVNEDWDANGTVGNAGDTNLYNLEHFGTDKTTVGTGATDVVFRPTIAGVTATTGVGALTYATMFRATDGGSAPVNATEASINSATLTDNANPVVVKVDYTKVVSQGQVVAGSARDEYGTVKIHFSEPVELGSVGEILLAGQPVTLKNLDKNIDQKVQQALAGGEDPKTGNTAANRAISLTFVPNPTGNTLSFGAVDGALTGTGAGTSAAITETGAATATNPDLTALANASAGINAVATAAPSGLQMTGARLANVFAGATEINAIIVDYNQNVARATNATDADVDGMYVVRARVGSSRVSTYENRSTSGGAAGSIDTFYDFYISGANIKVGTAGLGGAASVTLFITETSTSAGLPADTQAIWVDYEGNNTATSRRNIRTTNQNTLASVGSGDRFANIAVDSAGTTAITTDADTASVTFSPLKLANLPNGAGSTKNLLTQTIIGTAKGSGSNLGDNTAIRADLVALEEPPALAGIPSRDVTLAGDGRINVRRGPNSEGTGAQDIALKVQGIAAKDFADYAKAIRDYNAAVKSKVTDPGITNAQRIDELLKPERDVLIQRFNVPAGNIATGTATAQITGTDSAAAHTALGALNGKLYGFVEITTGAGKDAVTWSNQNTGATNTYTAGGAEAGAYSGNPNSEFGRTATLTRNLPNIQRNGTTYYPVEINLYTGVVTAAAGNEIGGGQLFGSFPEGYNLLGVAASNTRKVGFRVLDTAYALVKNGVYNVIVGAKEQDFKGNDAALVPASTVKDAFVQVSVFNAVSGEWNLTTSADPSFAQTSPTSPAGHIKFSADLLKNTNIPTRNNIELANIGSTTIRSINGWQLLGITGELARTTTAPLQMRAFMTLDKDSGAPIANFEADNKGKDEAFTLGLDAAAPNKLNVAFEGPNQVIVNNINPKPGAGVAFNYNTAFTAGTDGGTGPAGFNNPNGTAQTDGRFNDALDPTLINSSTKGLKWFYPIKSAAPSNAKLLKNSWHLITIQADKTLTALPAGIDAVIIVDGANGAKAWFRGEAATAALDTFAVKKGDAVFVHVGNADVTGFGF